MTRPSKQTPRQGRQSKKGSTRGTQGSTAKEIALKPAFLALLDEQPRARHIGEYGINYCW